MTALEIVLTPEELTVGATIGIQRRIRSMQAGRKNNHGYGGESAWDVDIEGACAELAVAKAINRYWQAGIDTFKGGDVGHLQVRMSKRRDASLIIRKDDPDEQIYFLVTGESPKFQIRGWIRAGDAKDPRFLREPNGRELAWFVPQTALKPVPQNSRAC